MMEGGTGSDTWTCGLGWLGRTLAGKREVKDLPVLAEELLLFLLHLRQCPGTTAVLGCDWWESVVGDNAGVGPDNEEGKKGVQVRCPRHLQVNNPPS